MILTVLRSVAGLLAWDSQLQNLLAMSLAVNVRIVVRTVLTKLG